MITHISVSSCWSDRFGNSNDFKRFHGLPHQHLLQEETYRRSSPSSIIRVPCKDADNHSGVTVVATEDHVQWTADFLQSHHSVSLYCNKLLMDDIKDIGKFDMRTFASNLSGCEISSTSVEDVLWFTGQIAPFLISPYQWEITYAENNNRIIAAIVEDDTHFTWG